MELEMVSETWHGHSTNGGYSGVNILAVKLRKPASADDFAEYLAGVCRTCFGDPTIEVKDLTGRLRLGPETTDKRDLGIGPSGKTNPYFLVTGEDGSYSILEIPVPDKLGKLSSALEKQVTVPDGQNPKLTD